MSARTDFEMKPLPEKVEILGFVRDEDVSLLEQLVSRLVREEEKARETLVIFEEELRQIREMQIGVQAMGLEPERNGRLDTRKAEALRRSDQQCAKVGGFRLAHKVLHEAMVAIYVDDGHADDEDQRRRECTD